MRRALVLDANILIRAVLGERVAALLAEYASMVDFLAPDAVYVEVSQHLPEILTKRGVPSDAVTQVVREAFDRLPLLVTPMPLEAYAEFETAARRRLARRDESDWPVVALALQMGCPIWTEDRDFFGSGIPTWTTDRVEIFLGSAPG